MYKFYLFSLVFIFSLCIISCKKMNEPIDDNIPGKSQFPRSVGSVWEYAIVDTLFYTYTGATEIFYDTVKVTIADSTLLPDGKKATIWQYKFKNKIDSLFAYLSGDTLLFYYINGNYLIIKFGFILPLKVDNEWRLPILDYKVFLTDAVQVPAGLFVNVFDVREYVRQGNAIGWNHYFIAPQVGIVNYYYGTFVTLSEVNHKIEWKLLSYHITE